jgi:hypothetical protein
LDLFFCRRKQIALSFRKTWQRLVVMPFRLHPYGAASNESEFSECW